MFSYGYDMLGNVDFTFSYLLTYFSQMPIGLIPIVRKLTSITSAFCVRSRFMFKLSINKSYHNYILVGRICIFKIFYVAIFHSILFCHQCAMKSWKRKEALYSLHTVVINKLLKESWKWFVNSVEKGGRKPTFLCIL